MIAIPSATAPWGGPAVPTRLRELDTLHREQGSRAVADGVTAALQQHHQRLDVTGLMLYAGTNVMSPAVAAAHDTAVSTRPALGWPGAKVQPGMQEIESVEFIAATQVARSMRGTFAETRFPTATMANLALYSAFTEPGDTIAVLSPEAGGHASHHAHGTAGIRGLQVAYLPYQPDLLDVDGASMAEFVDTTRPRLIVVGGSVTLFPHDLAPVRAAADRVGAVLAYDASHAAGLIAAGYVQDPLADGADVVTFSTYKTYGGPAGGAAVTNDVSLAERLAHAAYPVLSSNYDAARLGPLAIAAAEAVEQRPAWAELTIIAAQELAARLSGLGQIVPGRRRGFTQTHQVVVDVSDHGGGAEVMARLERVGIHAGTCRLPWQQVRSGPQGLRLGTQEIVRLGFTLEQLPELATLLDDRIRDKSDDAEATARVTALRSSVAADLWGRPLSTSRTPPGEPR